MRRCIQLAENGRQNAAPNPTVGAVIVCNGRIIGEGYHTRCGEAHAEVNAIRSVKDPSLLPHSTIYVSLEPCAHYGKTPPCADLIIEKRIPRIVIGCEDPFPKVSGRGIQKLMDAGREVKVGVLEAECRRLIRRFVTFHTLHRPYITLKWAESADGFIDINREGGTPVKLSSPLTQMLVHKRRTEHATILVGIRTALLDNPSLTVRHWYGRQPVRVVIDQHQSLPRSLHLFDGTVPTIVLTDGNLPDMMQELYDRDLQSLLVEGGNRILQSFLDADLWDEIYVEQSPLLLHDGVKSPKIPPGHDCDTELHFTHTFRHYTFTHLPI